MPQFVAPFTIKDGSATPADVTYGPEDLSSGSTLLVDRRLPSRDQQPSLKILFERPVAQRPSYKQTIEGVIPVVRQVSGVDVVGSRPLRAKLVFELPNNATLQERKHLQAMIVNAANQTLIKAGTIDIDPLY